MTNTLSTQATSGPAHKYLYSYDVDGPSAPARVARIVGKNQEVLEIGSGPGALTSVLHEVGTNRVTALEIDPTAIEIVQKYCVEVIQADLNSESWPEVFNGKLFDAVIAADVLEHVNNPAQVLKGMVRLLNKDGAVVISVPNISHAAIGSLILDSNFRYGDWGLLDRTHIRFFGMKDIKKLLDAADLVAVHVEFVVKHPEETEFADIWQKIPTRSKNALLELQHSMIYQFVVKAVPKTRANIRAVDIDSVPVEGWKNPYAVPELVLGFRSVSLVGKLIRLPGQIFRTIGRHLP